MVTQNRKKIQFVTARSNQMPETYQITKIDSTCAPIFELPFDISTMLYIYRPFLMTNRYTNRLDDPYNDIMTAFTENLIEKKTFLLVIFYVKINGQIISRISTIPKLEPYLERYGIRIRTN